MSKDQPLNDSNCAKDRIAMDDLSRYITLVSVECNGSGYTAEREPELRFICDKEPYAVNIHGQHGQAAGPDIGFDIVVFIAQAVASELIVQVFKAAVTQIIKAFRKRKCNDTSLSRAELHTKDCIYQISACGEACDRNIDYDSLIRQMADFTNAERDQRPNRKQNRDTMQTGLQGPRVRPSLRFRRKLFHLESVLCRR